MLNKFFETEFGQKILLFLAPFFLSPHEFKDTQKGSEKSIIKHLHLSAFAPLLGSVFLTGAVVAVFRTLLNKGISISWILNYKSANLIFAQAALFTWLGYSAALSRYISGWLLKALPTSRIKSDFMWPLAFWLSYYGGVLIICGVFAWIIVGFLSLHFSYTSGSIAFIVIVALGFYLRLEIKLAQEENRSRIHYIDWGVYNKVSLGVFIALQIIGGLLVNQINLMTVSDNQNNLLKQIEKESSAALPVVDCTDISFYFLFQRLPLPPFLLP